MLLYRGVCTYTDSHRYWHLEHNPMPVCVVLEPGERWLFHDCGPALCLLSLGKSVGAIQMSTADLSDS